MVKRTFSASVVGVDAEIITIEVDTLQAQLPSFTIVGLPDKAVQEAKERIISAIKNSGLEWPRKKIVVNLAPADTLKTGTGFDLPIAIAILAATDQVPGSLESILFAGELSLDGKLNPISGTLPIALNGVRTGFQKLIVPEANAKEGGLVKNLSVLAARDLRDVVNYLNGSIDLQRVETNFEEVERNSDFSLDFSTIRGQQTLKRAAVIAVAGGHNMLFVGTPGSGKTMISRSLPSIFPALTFEEALELTKIYSVANQIGVKDSVITQRPFRSPHHTASTIAIIGGGKNPRPGEVSLAHRGVLFLDEFPEFSSYTLEALRQPLEDKLVVISRVSGTLTFPANFMLVAAMNPCKCGWRGDPERECICTPMVIERYRKKISGPILDRIDLQVQVERIKVEELAVRTEEKSSTSDSIRDIVQNCRDLQIQRLKDFGVFYNSEIKQKDIETVCKIESDAKSLLLSAAGKLNLSARSYFRILRVARTIADLEQSETIEKRHIAEALQYRINE